MSRIVIIGAGMVGRGLVGELFSTSGWQVHFLDLDDALITRLNADRGYRHCVVGRDAHDAWISRVTASSVQNHEVALEVIASADLVATAVGQHALPAVAALLALVASRRARGYPPLNVLLCENLHEADRRMRAWMLDSGLPSEDLDRLALVRTVIGRMIPVATGQASEVRTEAYGYLPVDGAALLEPPDLPARVIVDPLVPFDFYADRKLYVHNLGHFLTALIGRSLDLGTIHEVIAEEFPRYLVRAAMIEAGTAVATRYDQPIGPLLIHVDDLLRRFANPALNDSVDRVARDPGRKLQPGDRVLGALELCRAEGVDPTHLRLAEHLGNAAVSGRTVAPAEIRQLWAKSIERLGDLQLI
jgi:mannitol-1-phosphate 5-dehydrogenase